MMKQPKPTLTPDIIRHAGMDAGNRSMRKAGRTKWNKADFDAATEELTRLRRIVEVENA